MPVCPLCNNPISVSPGEVPDHRVSDESNPLLILFKSLVMQIVTLF